LCFALAAGDGRGLEGGLIVDADGVGWTGVAWILSFTLSAVRAGGDDNFDGRLDPAALVVDACDDADGVKDLAGGWVGAFGLIDDVSGGHADIF